MARTDSSPAPYRQPFWRSNDQKQQTPPVAGLHIRRGRETQDVTIVSFPKPRPLVKRKHRFRQGNRTWNLLDTGGVLLGSRVIDSTSRRVGHARGGKDGSVCRVLGGSGGPANRERRAARLL